MSIFTYHLVKIPYFSALRMILFPPKSKNISGLIHLESMSCMILGSPVFSFSRILVRQVVVFAQWENERAFDDFLAQNSFGKTLSKGWCARLIFLRKWGEISGFHIPNKTLELDSVEESVVAVTLARMKFTQIPRFIKWGRPVEKLVRDHSGTILSLASIRFPNLVSTFSVWKSQKEMTDMVFGHNSAPNSKKHLNAMKERERKDFHFEFSTLRFKAISEFGQWNGQKNIIPNLVKK